LWGPSTYNKYNNSEKWFLVPPLSHDARWPGAPLNTYNAPGQPLGRPRQQHAVGGASPGRHEAPPPYDPTPTGRVNGARRWTRKAVGSSPACPLHWRTLTLLVPSPWARLSGLGEETWSRTATLLSWTPRPIHLGSGGGHLWQHPDGSSQNKAGSSRRHNMPTAADLCLKRINNQTQTPKPAPADTDRHSFRMSVVLKRL
jgi:hypothetical protein